MSTIRYMGTKRELASIVRQAFESCAGNGRVADLFSGMGAIAQAVSTDSSVLLNDVMEFPTVFARAHCLEHKEKSPALYLEQLYPAYMEQRCRLRHDFNKRLSCEKDALNSDATKLAMWLREAPHAGNCATYNRMASFSDQAKNYRHYRLTTLYFSAGYFSTAQAIDLDALRYAIDKLKISKSSTAPFYAVWLSTASTIINSPGHSAQYLVPNSHQTFKRIRRQMTRNVWEIFVDRARQFSPWGGSAWRNNNTVTQKDALTLIKKGLPSDIRVVYADPPYTTDQYSRFYHVFETMLLNDYPESQGQGRYRNDRYSSPFCLKTTAISAFETLFDGVKSMELPLVLSYPSNGVLSTHGINIEDFVRQSFRRVKSIKIESSHSTLGASKGLARQPATEYIFTCH